MNPGSSQFASQFPDAEETMSKMESKKLQTVMVNGEACPKVVSGNLSGCIDAWEHDARLAHEMLPVIKQLVESLKAVHPYVSFEDDPLESALCEFNAERAIAAAAPFLED